MGYIQRNCKTRGVARGLQPRWERFQSLMPGYGRRDGGVLMCGDVNTERLLFCGEGYDDDARDRKCRSDGTAG